MIIAIASGKGGTGKTTLAVNLAQVLAEDGQRVRLLDCDVEEPNDHLFVRPEFTQRQEVTVPKPVWSEDRCTGCGACAEACNYNALAVVKGQVLVFNELCHSCGACVFVCPEQALSERATRIGTVEAAPDHQPFAFVHGTLDVAEALAPSVVKAVKAHIDPAAINLIDAAPGTACSVVEAVSDADAVLLVTEPTPFGLNDLKLAVSLSLQLGRPTGIVINRSDGDDRLIVDYAAAVGVPIAGRIPFSRAYAQTYAGGGLLVEHHPELREICRSIYQDLAVATPPVPPLDELVVPSEPPPPPAPTGTTGSHREVVVISGKGGTGKTTVTACFCQLAESPVLADNDVDAADLHLLLTPRIREGQDFVGGVIATVNSDDCIGCGRCAEACHFDAFRFDGPANDLIAKTWRIDPVACEGCGLCPRVCPVGAITTEPSVVGRWFVSDTDWGPMVHARLGVAAENSGKLVTRVRRESDRVARENGRSLIVGDGPPGTGCPVIASISGADLVVIVTEPTVSGVHDLERVLGLAAHFRLPVAVIVNKADLDATQSGRIAEQVERHGARLIGEIPFDREVNEALMNGTTVIDHKRGPAAAAIRQAWLQVEALINPSRVLSD